MKAATFINAHSVDIINISIHAAREGGDYIAPYLFRKLKLFQSTPPVKAATGMGRYSRADGSISIHAAREGGDVRPYIKLRHLRLFQSTPPVKAATSSCVQPVLNHAFQSTPPVKAATYRLHGEKGKNCISIHAAREGGDSAFARKVYDYRIFQSTPPVKAATVRWWKCSPTFNDFNPRRP